MMDLIASIILGIFIAIGAAIYIVSHSWELSEFVRKKFGDSQEEE